MSIEMVGVVIFGFLGILGIFLISKSLKELRFSKNIIDSVPDMILIYKDSHLADVNKSFFTYFDTYASMKDFIEENGSISTFFEAEEGCLHALALDGSSWFEYVKKVKSAKVKLKIQKKEYYFSMNLSFIDKNSIALIFSDTTQLVKSLQEIKNLTLFDPETNIGNRKYCDIKIKQEVAVAQRYKHSLSILMLEIDNFVEIQNLHGEVLATKLQSTYVKLILSHLREIDIFCRFSGTKFLIILPSTDLAGARQVARKLSDAVSLSQKILPITMSFGVAAYTSGQEIIMFLAQVERALLNAKELGTNRIVLG